MKKLFNSLQDEISDNGNIVEDQSAERKFVHICTSEEYIFKGMVIGLMNSFTEKAIEYGKVDDFRPLLTSLEYISKFAKNVDDILVSGDEGEFEIRAGMNGDLDYEISVFIDPSHVLGNILVDPIIIEPVSKETTIDEANKNTKKTNKEETKND